MKEKFRWFQFEVVPYLAILLFPIAVYVVGVIAP